MRLKITKDRLEKIEARLKARRAFERKLRRKKVSVVAKFFGWTPKGRYKKSVASVGELISYLKDDFSPNDRVELWLKEVEARIKK